MQYQGHPDQRWGHISYAQHGDDFFLINIFELLGIDRPSFLDLGAHHPITISNTALLYERGSRGVNVEANPNLMKAFETHRPEDTNVNIGVGLEAGQMPFFMFDEYSGRNTFSESERDKMVAAGYKVRGTRMVDVLPLETILAKYCNGRWPDLLTLDLEGMDYDVLAASSIGEIGPSVICVETRHHEGTRMKAMMASRGYFCLVRLAENLVFIANRHIGKVH